MTTPDTSPGGGEWLFALSLIGVSFLLVLGLGALIRYAARCWYRGKAQAWYAEQHRQWRQSLALAEQTVETRLYERQEAER